MKSSIFQCLTLFALCIGFHGVSGQPLALDLLIQSGSNQDNNFSHVTTDQWNNIYTLGRFVGSIDLDPGPGTQIFNALSSDIYIQKFDSTGNFIRAGVISSNGADWPSRLMVDSLGEIYILGHFTGREIDLDPRTGSGDTLIIRKSKNTGNAFICKLDTSGALVWARTFGDTSEVFTDEMQFDPYGNIVIGGRFQETVNFNFSGGIDTFTSNGIHDLFYLKMDKAGDYLNTYVAGGPDRDGFGGITIGKNGHLFATGSFHDSVDFDAGPQQRMEYSAGNSDIFLLELDDNLNLVEVLTFGGPGLESSTSISVDTQGNRYLTAFFEDTVDFDPGPQTANTGVAGMWNHCILKLDSNNSFSWVRSGSSVDVMSIYAQLNQFNCELSIQIYPRDTFVFDSNGPSDTIIPLRRWAILLQAMDLDGTHKWMHLFGEGGHPSAGPQHFDQNGRLLLAGTVDEEFDIDPSSAVVNLTPTVSGTDDAWLARFDYNSPPLSVLGWDSIVACTPIIWLDGNTYSTSNNTATHTLPGLGQNGCDSVVQLNLTIVSSDMGLSFTDTSISVNQAGASYSWFECSGSSWVQQGSTSQSIVPQNSGSYVVVVDNQACLDTSVCQSFFLVSIDPPAALPGVSVYPNPASTTVHIDFEQIRNGQINLMDVNGRLVKSIQVQNERSAKIELNGVTPGQYMLQFMDSEDQLGFPLIIIDPHR